MEQTFHKMTKDDVPEPGDHWIEVTQGMSGYFAVQMWVNDEGDLPFPEPYETGYGRYRTKAEAAAEAVLLAEERNLPYRLPKEAV